MSKESVLSVGVAQPDDETRLTEAIEAFTRWRADIAPDKMPDNDAPAIIVRTAWGDDGALRKTLIFDDEKWAAFFLKIWQRDSHA